MKIAVIGAGSFGKALYAQLCERHDVVLWKRGEDIKSAVSGKEMLVFAVPAQSFREVFTNAH